MLKHLDGKEIKDFESLKRTKKVLKICDSCGAESRPQWRIAKRGRECNGKDYCQSCGSSKHRKQLPTKHGRKVKHGQPGNYVLLWDERRKKYVPEHHIIVENMAGFDLIEHGWYIHHINGVKDDNSPKNLCAIPTNSQHKKIHRQLEQVAFELVRRGVIRFDMHTCKYFIDPVVYNSTMPVSLGFEDIALQQKKAVISSRSQASISSEIIRDVHLEVPLIASNMNTVTNSEFCILLEKLGAMGVLHRADSDSNLEKETKKIARHNNLVAVSVGVGSSQFKLAKKLIRANANIIFIDVAHGYCQPVIELGKKIKQFTKNVHIVVGNTVHPGLFAESAEFASAVKVGIAQGFACETKNTAGITEKQFSAIQNCLTASKTYGLPIISDGGVREPADFVKAIAGGASSVMAGKIFAACPESAADINEDGKKIYAGMASRMVQEKWRGNVSNDTPEGGTRLLDIGESVSKLVKRYSGALRSGISYSGASSVQELQQNASFIFINK